MSISLQARGKFDIILNVASLYSDGEAPDRAGGVLHPPEDVVQAQVVSHSILPAVRIVTVECESIGKPNNQTD